MIKGFKDKDTEKLFRGEHNTLPADIHKRGHMALSVLNGATTINDIKKAGRKYRLKKRGDIDKWEMRVNDQWRLRFVWHDGDAYRVEILDQH